MHVMEQTNEAARERFEQLFERHRAAVAAYVRRRAPAEAVEDVVAETFLAAWRALERLDDDALPWLYGVAARVLANDRRRRRRRGALGVRLASQRDRPTDPLAVEVSEPLRSALVALGPKEREAVLLVAWEGLTPQQGARAAGCTAVAFRGRLHRARRRLARTLGGAPIPLTEEARGT
jgi:RNA polymerase sigma factor (sigma-70 family)